MIPVYQTRFGWGEGDCFWACLASIFEEPLESFHYGKLLAPNDPDIAKLSECRWPRLKFHFDDLGRNYRLVDGPSVPGHPHPQRWKYDPPAEWDAPTLGYWIASVFSQKLRHPIESPYYGMPGLHAVIMHGRHVVHDPNPHNVPYESVSPIMRTWWTPL